MTKTVFHIFFFFIITLGITGCDDVSQRSKTPVISGIIFQEDQFFLQALAGMKAGAKQFRVKLETANTTNDLNKESQIVRRFIKDKVDAICISPLSSSKSIPPLLEAHQQGIKIVTYNSALDADFPISFMTSDQYELGEQSGESAKTFILRNRKPTTQIATLAFEPLAKEISDKRVNGFLDQVTGLPGVEVVSQQNAWLEEDAYEQTLNLLAQHPDIDLIFTANEGSTVGATRAVKTSTHAKRIKVFGVDVSSEIINLLLSSDNILQATTGQHPTEMGRSCVETAVRALRGQTITPTRTISVLPLQRNQTESVIAFRTMLDNLSH